VLDMLMVACTGLMGDRMRSFRSCPGMEEFARLDKRDSAKGRWVREEEVSETGT
jgi:hypothetical protein